nr:PREDICTED: pheromone-binding protein-related protein 6-like [Tribolium castaneum]|eukprot:XP_015835846.1 PREDICTED: pheromone-binding protein-related protein 6-like [Tribolium castaneum]
MKQFPKRGTMYKTRVIYVLFALCLVEIFAIEMDDDMKELINNLHNTCTGETGATDDQIENARKGNFAEDDSFKCYFKCVFDQMGCMTDDGKVDSEAVIAVMPPELADKIASTVRGCTEVGANPCETAWLANKCYQKSNPDMYFVP